jgi:hypothetical protein
MNDEWVSRIRAEAHRFMKSIIHHPSFIIHHSSFIIRRSR